MFNVRNHISARLWATAVLLGTLAFVRVSGRPADPFPDSTGITNASPTTQSCQQVDPKHQVCFVSNPPLPSAKGGAFGPNHGLQSNHASPGYKLVYAAFALSGSHPCFGDDYSPHGGPGGEPWGIGFWAHCWITSRTGDHVTWGYTMMGEQGATSVYPTFDNGPGVKFEREPDSSIKEAARLTLIYAKE
jgi:hypothetical protein